MTASELHWYMGRHCVVPLPVNVFIVVTETVLNLPTNISRL